MWTVVDSPVGELRLVEHEGAITAIEFSPFTEPDVLVPGAGPARGPRDDEHPVLARAREQLAAYFAGELTEFDLPLAPRGTPWQQLVWQQLSAIGYGQTSSYGQVAARLGRTNAASRAVGLANGRNPIPIVIPCHRVVGADGTLTGYAGGLERKQVLLRLEQGGLF